MISCLLRQKKMMLPCGVCVTFGFKNRILHSCLSTRLQQQSLEGTAIVERLRTAVLSAGRSGRANLLHFKNKEEKKKGRGQRWERIRVSGEGWIYWELTHTHTDEHLALLALARLRWGHTHNVGSECTIKQPLLLIKIYFMWLRHRWGDVLMFHSH